MKKLVVILSIIVVVFSCKNKNSVVSIETSLGDTIQTASGLKYYYLNRGNGKKINEGSKVAVYTDLYLNDSDSVFWTTSTASDSLFTFYHKKTSLIKGFSELHNYLVEGDEVIAILPDSIAYGKEGRNGVPPAATLVYNPLIVNSVSEPKILLSDSIFSIVTTQDIEAGKKFYEKVMTSEVKNIFHTDMDLMVNNLLRSLLRDSLYAETESFAKFLLTKTNDNMHQRTLAFQASSAAEAQENYEVAISYLEPWAKKEPEQPWWKNKINELKGKLNK